jgi:hypothetical protein
MNIKEIKSFVQSQILASLNGAKVENNKFDFKSQWYDWSKPVEESKFVKDLTALVNAYGGGHGFLVIGYDDDKKTFNGSPFTLSKWKDDAELVYYLKGRVDRAFNIQVFEDVFKYDTASHQLTILHIPPSLNKPHIVRNMVTKGGDVPNQVYIRNGSTNENATKSDLDLMYAEKASLQLERKVTATLIVNDASFSMTSAGDAVVRLTLPFHFENVGTRTVMIRTVRFAIRSPHFDDLQFSADFKIKELLYSFSPGEILTKSFRYDVRGLDEDLKRRGVEYGSAFSFIDYLNRLLRNSREVQFVFCEFTLSSGELLRTDVSYV